MRKKCLHKKVEVSELTTYEIPQGWDKVQGDGFDLGDYEILENTAVITCTDCKKLLDEIN